MYQKMFLLKVSHDLVSFYLYFLEPSLPLFSGRIQTESTKSWFRAWLRLRGVSSRAAIERFHWTLQELCRKVTARKKEILGTVHPLPFFKGDLNIGPVNFGFPAGNLGYGSTLERLWYTTKVSCTKANAFKNGVRQTQTADLQTVRETR